MLFNSYSFIFLFLPLALIGYFGLNRVGKQKAAVLFLLLMSLLFAGFGSIYNSAALLVNLLVNYVLAGRMRDAGKKKRKKIMVLGILFNLGILFLFKYYNFFAENINGLFGDFLPGLSLALPLGISFYTFAQIAYLADCYQADKEEHGNEIYSYSLLEYAAYISFFPKLIQGPIAYHNELIPAFRNSLIKKVDFTNLSKGIYAFALGLSKKVLLADTLAKIVNIGYNNIDALNTGDAVLVMVCYSLQIYFDFSGYCDMAYGIGYMLNIKLPVNFNSPYKAVSITDFWDRWHMTLTRFFTRYLYIPLGGSRKGKTRTMVNIMIVFLLSGLWHGANWTFLLWGALNGIVMVLERILHVKEWKRLPGIRRVAAFVISTFAWSIFRADSVSQAGSLWGRLFTGGHGLYVSFSDCFNGLVEVSILRQIGFGALMERYPCCLLLLFVIALVLACFFMRNTQEKAEAMQFTNRKAVVTVILLVWSILSLSEISEFIYFNF